MKVVIVNKSDSVGGAAVVSFRLMNALRDAGVSASMLVVDKHTDSPYVHTAGSGFAVERAFLAERLKIFLANGMNRQTLFKIDTASDGLVLTRNPLVSDADVICLNWVNQGMLSLKGLSEILKLGKPVVWTMHDMWNFTGICHHAGSCVRYLDTCGCCPLLGKKGKESDLSSKVYDHKKAIYSPQIHFVAVSNWLAGLARQSSLLRHANLSVIPNAFPIPEESSVIIPAGLKQLNGADFRIVMGAARLDDTVKGLPILLEATRLLRDEWPEQAERMELVTFGNFRNPEVMSRVGIRHRHLGMIKGEEKIREIYCGANAVVSTSLYETLPGTLVEGQVYGCIPVSFNRGGQSDIVDHLVTGYLAEWNDDIKIASRNIAEGLIWAKERNPADMRPKMFESARNRFSAPAIARAYISLFESMLRS